MAIEAVSDRTNQLRSATPKYTELPESVAGPVHAVYDVYHQWLLSTQSRLVEYDLFQLTDALRDVLAQLERIDESSGDRIGAESFQ